MRMVSLLQTHTPNITVQIYRKHNLVYLIEKIDNSAINIISQISVDQLEKVNQDIEARNDMVTNVANR